MPAAEPSRSDRYPVGASVTVEELEATPHAALARLRRAEPVSWLPALDRWYVTSWAGAVAVLRDAGTFTVDDPRFTTGQVLGPSMLSRDGAEHDRHRAPFVPAFRGRSVGRANGSGERPPAWSTTSHR